MIFKTLTIQNFLSIRSVTLDLQDRGLVLIKGLNRDNPDLNNNGSGKSSMIEALVYALYGRTLRGLKGDAVVHNIPGKNMKIFLDIVDDDGVSYRIARYRKHSTNKNKSFLFRDGVDITPKSEQDFNDYIVDLLQADYLAFTASLLYSAESFKFTSASDAEMKKTFDVMLGLDTFSKCLDITKVQLTENKSKLDTAEWKIDDRKKKLDFISERIEKTKEESKNYLNMREVRLTELQQNTEELTENLLKENEKLLSLQQNYESLKLKQSSLESQLEICNSKLESYDELRVALQELKDEISSKERSINKLDRNSSDIKEEIQSCTEDTVELEKKISIIKAKKDKLLETIGTPCPTCGSPLSESSIEPAQLEYDNKIDSVNNKILVKNNKISELSKCMEDNSVKVKELEKELEELNNSSEEFERLLSTSSNLYKEKTKYEAHIQSHNKKIYQAKSLVTAKELEIKQIILQMENNSKEIERIKNEENPYVNTLSDLKEEQNLYELELKTCQEEVAEKQEERRRLEFWQQAYSNQGIKSLVLDSVTPFLNKQVNKYLRKLTSGHIEVKFNTQTTLKNGSQKEKFSIEVVNKDGGDDYLLNSGGERKRIDLCINLALQDLVASRSNKKFEIAIFDEVLDALDETGIERVMELLQEISKDKSSIFVVSHNEHLKSYFSNVITIQKKDGYSTLYQE